MTRVNILISVFFLMLFSKDIQAVSLYRPGQRFSLSHILSPTVALVEKVVLQKASSQEALVAVCAYTNTSSYRLHSLYMFDNSSYSFKGMFRNTGWKSLMQKTPPLVVTVFNNC